MYIERKQRTHHHGHMSRFSWPIVIGKPVYIRLWHLSTLQCRLFHLKNGSVFTIFLIFFYFSASELLLNLCSVYSIFIFSGIFCCSAAINSISHKYYKPPKTIYYCLFHPNLFYKLFPWTSKLLSYLILHVDWNLE